jgi:hypothetical protein
LQLFPAYAFIVIEQQLHRSKFGGQRLSWVRLGPVGQVGSMSSLPESGSGWAIYEMYSLQAGLAIRHRLLTEFFPPIESARQESNRADGSLERAE